MGFPRQEYWSGLPFLSPGDLPDPGIEPTSPPSAGGFFTTEPPGKAWNHPFNNICSAGPELGLSLSRRCFQCTSFRWRRCSGRTPYRDVSFRNPQSLAPRPETAGQPAVVELLSAAWEPGITGERLSGGSHSVEGRTFQIPGVKGKECPAFWSLSGAHIGHNTARSWTSRESGRYNAQRSVSWGQSWAEKGPERGRSSWRPASIVGARSTKSLPSSRFHSAGRQTPDTPKTPTWNQKTVMTQSHWVVWEKQSRWRFRSGRGPVLNRMTQGGGAGRGVLWGGDIMQRPK